MTSGASSQATAGAAAVVAQIADAAQFDALVRNHQGPKPLVVCMHFGENDTYGQLMDELSEFYAEKFDFAMADFSSTNSSGFLEKAAASVHKSGSSELLEKRPRISLWKRGTEVEVLRADDSAALFDRLETIVDYGAAAAGGLGPGAGGATTAEAEAEGETQTAEEQLNKKLSNLINSQPVMLFMKGHREEPFCKFSKVAVRLMNEVRPQKDYGTFNILDDEEVRQGLKTFSNWPTYPQLYVKGELQGGVDIMQEMHDDGEFGELINEAYT